MDAGPPKLNGLFRSQRARMIAASVAVTVVTAGIIATALLAFTPAGCSVAKAFGFKGTTCAGGHPVASRTTPTPLYSPGFTPRPTPTPLQPTINPASSIEPYPPPASGYPPQPDQGSPSYPIYPFLPLGSNPAQFPFQLSCSLPVYAGGAGSGGFVTFPGANFIADPKSSVVLPTPAGSNPGPGGPGPGPALSYDRAHSQWLPIDYSLVTPDGSRYAFVGQSGIYVVAVAGGTITQIGTGRTWRIVGVKNEGVYAEEQSLPGLWLLPYSGGANQITALGYWQLVDGAAAFGTATSAVPSGAANTIIKLDMKTGSTTDWFTRPGIQSSVAGSDGHGNPIIYAYGNQGTTVWIAGAPGNALLIAASYAGFNPGANPIADRNGVWFTGYSSRPLIALYVPGSGIYEVAALGGNLAGGCS